MLNNKKAKNNQGYGKGSNQNTSNNQGNENRNQGHGNQGYQKQGNQNQNRNQENSGGNQGAGRGYQGKNPRGGKYNPPQGRYNPPSDSSGQNQGTNDYDVDTSNISDHLHFVSLITNDDVIVPALILDEYPHDPSTLPSHHLNVTVSVQDKDKKCHSSVRRTVGKTVLDTTNYSEDFISYHMIEKVNAMHVCYEAPTAITISSGLDGHCYSNDEIIDLNLKFYSYDGERHSIPLTLRGNRITDIDLLLSRKTVNKHDFMSLTPFAFGIYPELSAENKKKSDTCRREFEEREAINKFDPLHMHKYTRHMISEGFEPEKPEVESTTPTYDLLKGVTQKKLAQKRELYGLCAKPTPKKPILRAPLIKKVVGSGCHTLSTCNVTQIGIEGVATQDPRGDIGCERLDSVTTILAKRTGDTPHLGGDSIPILTHTSEDTETSDYDAEALWPSGVALSIDKIDDDKTDTFAPFLRDKTCRNVPPNGQMISCIRSILREMKAFRMNFVLSVQNTLICPVAS